MDDGFDPALAVLVLFFGAVLFVLIGAGIIVGLVCVACAGVFVGLGIVSSSALIAILSRRFSAGFRALHYQLSAAIALPCGISALWLGSSLCGVHLRNRYIFLAGSAIGIVAGICLAFILDWFVRFVYHRFTSKSEPSHLA